MGDSEQENEGDDGREFTEAHVFQKIPELENQAEQELAEGVTYCQFWLGEVFGGRKADYEPVIKRALAARALRARAPSSWALMLALMAAGSGHRLLALLLLR